MNAARRAASIALLLTFSALVGSVAGVPLVGGASAQVIPEEVLDPEGCDGSALLPGVLGDNVCLPEEPGDGNAEPTDCIPITDFFNQAECDAFLAGALEGPELGDGFTAIVATPGFPSPVLAANDEGNLVFTITSYLLGDDGYAAETPDNGGGHFFLRFDAYTPPEEPAAPSGESVGKYGGVYNGDGTWTVTVPAEDLPPAAMLDAFVERYTPGLEVGEEGFDGRSSHFFLPKELLLSADPESALVADILDSPVPDAPVQLFTPLFTDGLDFGFDEIGIPGLITLDIDVMGEDTIDEEHGKTTILVTVHDEDLSSLLANLEFTSPAPADIGPIHIKLGPEGNDLRYHLHGDMDDDGDLDLTELLTCFSNPLNAGSTCADPDADEDPDYAGDPNNNERVPHSEPPVVDADGDGILDDDDDCPNGDTGWTSDAQTDYDGDGCRDAGEDLDDDNDGVTDGNDLCDPDPSGPAGDFGADQSDKGWTSRTAASNSLPAPVGTVDGLLLGLFALPKTDHDGDGCRDAGEDQDDDNDGYADGVDDCPRGSIGWTATSAEDFDGDGCRDQGPGGEDKDDDNDGVIDVNANNGNTIDRCRTSVDGLFTGWKSANGPDHDGDGCKDDTVEDKDDDNDGYPDPEHAGPGETPDKCPTGETGVAPTSYEDPIIDGAILFGQNDPDTDFDGCRASEDPDGEIIQPPAALPALLPDPEQVLNNPDCSIVTHVTAEGGDPDCGELGDPTLVLEALLAAAGETVSLLDNQDSHDADGDGDCTEYNDQVDLVETFVVATTVTGADPETDSQDCSTSVFDPFRGEGETVVVFGGGFGSPAPAAILHLGDADATAQTELLIVEFHPLVGPVTVCIIDSDGAPDLVGPFEGTFADTGCMEEVPEPVDSDGDGIVDDEDACPDGGSEIDDADGDGCDDQTETDEDGDGVMNGSDDCPETADGASVDENGCEVEGGNPVLDALCAEEPEFPICDAPQPTLGDGDHADFGFTNAVLVADENGDVTVTADLYAKDEAWAALTGGTATFFLERDCGGLNPVCDEVGLSYGPISATGTYGDSWSATFTAEQVAQVALAGELPTPLNLFVQHSTWQGHSSHNLASSLLWAVGSTAEEGTLQDAADAASDLTFTPVLLVPVGGDPMELLGPIFDELCGIEGTLPFCPEGEPDADTDGDGVDDDLDQCPGTPEGAAVDSEGCPDSDGDGLHDQHDADDDNDNVLDEDDACPGTPAGAEVDDTGCETSDDGDLDPTQIPGMVLAFICSEAPELPICGFEPSLPEAQPIDDDEDGTPEGIWLDLDGDGERHPDGDEDFVFDGVDPLGVVGELIAVLCSEIPALPVCGEEFDPEAFVLGVLCSTPVGAELGELCGGEPCEEPCEEPCDPEGPTCEPPVCDPMSPDCDPTDGLVDDVLATLGAALCTVDGDLAGELGFVCDDEPPCDPETEECGGGTPDPCDPGANPIGCEPPENLPAYVNPEQECVPNPDMLVQICKSTGAVGIIHIVVMGETLINI